MRGIPRTGLSMIIAVSFTVGSRAAEPEKDRDERKDVMQPTPHGLRMTPRMAHALARYYVADEIETLVYLSDDQQSRLTDALERRVMQLTRTHQAMLRDPLERFFELMIRHEDGRANPQVGREFAECLSPALPVARQFLNGVADDARPILAPDQLEVIERKLRRDGKEMDRLEAKMRRWAAGGAKDREELDDFQPEDGEAPTGDERNPPRDRRRQAELWARRDLQGLGPREWAKLVAAAKYFLKFNDEQSAKADRLLAEYRQKAEAVMTAEWKARVLANRTRRKLYEDLGERFPAGPLLHHLDRENRQAITPILDLGRMLRKEVYAIATDAQLSAALARVREAAERHGATVDDADARMLGLMRD